MSFPIGLRILFAARPELLAAVLRITHRAIAGSLLKQAGPKCASADIGAVTLIQKFGSAANLNIHLHCLVLDGVYRRTEGERAIVALSISRAAGVLDPTALRWQHDANQSGRVTGSRAAVGVHTTEAPRIVCFTGATASHPVAAASFPMRTGSRPQASTREESA